MVREKLDERLVDRLWVEIEEADPLDPRDIGDASRELGETNAGPVATGEIAPVGDGVLRDEVQLFDALGGELLGFAHDVVGGP